jgi:hypothetical protein
METGKKTVTVEIPEGKKAVWNEQGVLQLVDDEPKDITERIKTFDDALNELAQRAERGDCLAHQLIEEYNCLNSEETSTDLLTYMQLRIITAALNEGWEPQFKEEEVRWFPYFFLWSKDEIDNMSDEDKDNRRLLLWGGTAGDGTCCGSSFSYSSSDWSNTITDFGSRLALKTEALATYAGRQFASVFARFYIGDKAKDAMPWREYEQKHESSDNK